MNEVTEVTDVVAAAKKGKGKKSSADNATGVEGQIGRMLVRAVWTQEWTAANPEGKPEERKAAWKEGRTAAFEAHLKQYRRAINALGRSGVTMTLSETAAKANAEDDEEA
ncbi:MAG: hypothetical protein ABI832_01480 [bacterium]